MMNVPKASSPRKRSLVANAIRLSKSPKERNMRDQRLGIEPVCHVSSGEARLNRREPELVLHETCASLGRL